MAIDHIFSLATNNISKNNTQQDANNKKNSALESQHKSQSQTINEHANKSKCPPPSEAHQKAQDKIAASKAQSQRVLSQILPMGTQEIVNAVNENLASENSRTLKREGDAQRHYRNIKNKYDTFKTSYWNEFQKYCERYPDKSVCTQYITHQNAILNKKLDDISPLVYKLQEIIPSLIMTYQVEQVSINRMNELKKLRKSEIISLNNEIDTLLKNINTDYRKNFYEENDQKFILKIREVIIYLFYQCLLIYFFTSDFFKNQYYKNIGIILIIILYILLPFIIQDILININKIYIYILKKLNLYHPKIKLLTDLNPNNTYPLEYPN